MKTIFNKYFLAAIVLYLISAYINVTFDITQWSEYSRIVSSIFYIFYLAMYIMGEDIDKQVKDKNKI